MGRGMQIWEKGAPLVLLVVLGHLGVARILHDRNMQRDGQGVSDTERVPVERQKSKAHTIEGELARTLEQLGDIDEYDNKELERPNYGDGLHKSSGGR